MSQEIGRHLKQDEKNKKLLGISIKKEQNNFKILRNENGQGFFSKKKLEK